jgi:predicted phosphodiesterase
MKWIILSDIHANLPALEAVLEDIERRFPGILSEKNLYKARIASLGDQIGYHPYPNEVMDRIWDLADELLIGNHDEGVYEVLTQGILREEYNMEAQWAMMWTAETLSSRNRERLIELCTRKQYLTLSDSVCFTHGRPDEPERMKYANSIEDVQSGYLWKNDSTRICFVGHTHDPRIFTCSLWQSGQVCIPRNTAGIQSFDLSGVDKTLVVVPSVGQPRDGFNYTGYCVYDADSCALDLVRLPYDIRQIQFRMRELSFPYALIDRLSYGD